MDNKSTENIAASSPLERFVMRNIAWLFYGAGHLVSIVMIGPLGSLYPVYNWLMLKSHDISINYDLGIWTNATDEISD